MNRFTREVMAGGRSGTSGSASLLLQQRKVRTGATAMTVAKKDGEGDDGLDLFSSTRKSLSVVPVTAEEESDCLNGPPKMGSMLVSKAKVPTSAVDDILSVADMGKNDYDWLLTPPGTPLRSSLEFREEQSSLVAPRSTSSAKLVTTAKISRFSSSPSENNHSTRPARSSSTTRPSVASSYGNHFSNSSSKTSVLNTSTASLNSYRPSSPARRSTAASVTSKQASAPASRPISSRSSTPIKARPAPISPAEKAPTSSTNQPRSLYSTRPSTPTTRPQISGSPVSSSSSATKHTGSRPSTPTRRSPSLSTPTVPSSTRHSTPTRRMLTSSTSSTIPASGRPSTPNRRVAAPSVSVPARSSSVGRVPAASIRNSAPLSRPSSPSPRIRPPAQSIVLPEFPSNALPNLRTKLPDRPKSAGRTRPGAALTSRLDMNIDASKSVNSTRSSSPVVTRVRLTENSTKGQFHNTVDRTTPPETLNVSDGTIRKPAKPMPATESLGFGRTISKKSIDMALRHMDIKQGIGGIRGASLFPQSIRSTATKGRIGRMSDPVARNGSAREDSECGMSMSGSYNGAISENSGSVTMSPDREFMKRINAPDVYESTRYESILLKEDSKNMSWLHSIEDKSDGSPVFDHRFEPLPEPFILP